MTPASKSTFTTHRTTLRASRTPTAPVHLRRAALALAAAVPLAHAAIEPAAQAPEANRPLLRVDAAAPIVEIVKPDANGVSLNAFARFDVDAAGAVLNNNAAQPAASALAGDVAANPALAQGAAQLIVTEVLGRGASQLRGQIEIAGQRADLIVANPDGVVCDGCGMVNAGRVVLAAGRLLHGADGTPSALQVDAGELRVGAHGLDAAGIDRLELLARRADIDGAVRANELRMYLGRVHQSLDGAVVGAVAAAEPAPQFALDIGTGGMLQAQRIALIVTEQGAGVRSAGPLHARGDALRVRADGLVELRGDVDGHGAVELDGSRIDLDGVHVRAGGDLNLRSTSAVRADQARIRAGGTLAVEAATAVFGSGAHWAGAGDVRVDAGSLDNVGGSWTAARRLDVSLRNALDNASGGALQGEHVQLRAKLIDNSGGTLHAERDLQLRAGAVSNRRGAIGAGNHLTLDAHSLDNLFGQIHTPGDLQLQVAGALDNVEGKLRGARTLDAAAGTSFDNTRGEVVSQQRARVAVGHLLRNGAGKLVAGDGGLHLDAAGATLDNVGGRVDAGAGDLRVQARQVHNASGTLGGSRLQLRAERVDNQRGTIQAGTHMDARVGLLRNGLGHVLAAEQVDLHADTLDNRDQGLLAAPELMLHAGAVDNVGGVLRARRQLTLHGRQIDNRGGMLDVGALRLRGEQFDNAAGRVLAAQDADIDLGGSLHNRAGHLSAAALQVRLGHRFDNAGGVVNATDGALRIDAAQGIDNSSGVIRGDTQAKLALRTPQGSLTNTAAGRISTEGKLRWEGRELDNRTGRIKANREMILRGVSVRNSDGGAIEGTRDAELSADWIDNRNGTLSSDDRFLGVDARQQIDNRGGLLSGREAIEVRTPMLLNDGGRIRGRRP